MTLNLVRRNENALIRELGIENSLVVLHAGNIGYPTDIETFIDCVKEMNGDKRFHFVFIGSGVKKPILEKAKASAGIANLTLLDPRPRSEQIRLS